MHKVNIDIPEGWYLEYNAVSIDSVYHIHIKDCARFLKKTVSGVRYLIEVGNSLNKLNARRLGREYFIPVPDLFTFKVLPPGNNGGRISHYTTTGEKEYCEECSE